MNHITALARVVGRTRSYPWLEDREMEVAFLDVPILPTSPIELGSYVCIAILEPKPPTVARMANYRDEPRYTAYTSDIRGRIIGIRAMEPEVTEFVLKNDNDDLNTKYAYVAVPHVEGTMVCLPWWARVVRWTLHALDLVAQTR
ncbi:hypothetical protein ONZ51_g2531 [Trametes cubensis]|uniref:Uncharacterized protein n=1 Tax=Trametes cubensis TaxID=1111947 RepID=A0AAD7TZE3_9APHY|nr:hypothetical protein ONZ51_g2531 [Trametes cubensis]